MALPEAGQRFASKLGPLIEPLGYRLRSSVGEGAPDVQGVTAAVSQRLGDVSFKIGHNTASFPDVEIVRRRAGRDAVRRLPFGRPGARAVPEWRDDMGLLPPGAPGATPAIVAATSTPRWTTP